MGELKPRSGVTVGQHWDTLGCCAGIYWDAVPRAGVPASPQELGKGHEQSLAALKQVLQLAGVHTGTFGLRGGQRALPVPLFGGHSARSQILCSEVEGEGSVQPRVTHSRGRASPSAK